MVHGGQRFEDYIPRTTRVTLDTIILMIFFFFHSVSDSQLFCSAIILAVQSSTFSQQLCSIP